MLTKNAVRFIDVQLDTAENALTTFDAKRCAECHAPPEYTAAARFDVGLADEVGNRRFNPPSLRGVGRRAPLFHDGRAASLEACRRLDAGIRVPWVILSAGVGYADFKRQVGIACTAGASGFLAGRSIWRDAVSTHDPAKREAAAADAAGRLAELAAVTRAAGRPYRDVMPPDAPLPDVEVDLVARWIDEGARCD